MMRRYFFLVFASVAAAVSCRQEEVPVDGNTIEQVDLVINARQEAEPAEGTRTTLVDWSYIRWMPQDEITVFTSVDDAKFTSVNTTPASSSQFTGTISVDTAASGDAAWIWALYPYDAAAVFDNQTITTTLPSNQEAVDGTFADDLLITSGRTLNPFINAGDASVVLETTGMGATSLFLDENGGGMTAVETETEGGTASPTTVFSNARTLQMTFQHVCAGLRFTLTKQGIESVTLTAIGGEPIAGTFTFAMDNDGMPVVQSVGTPSSSITLTAPGGGTFTPGVWYYFVTLPVTFSQGVAFTLESATQVGTREIRTPFSLSRGGFRKSTAMDQNVVMEDQEVEVQVADPTTWTAIDELGRSVLTAQNPSARENRDVLMFYWTWHEGRQVALYDANGRQYGGCFNGSGVPGITDNTVVLEQSGGAAANDFYHPYWRNSQVCFWGRPLFDYYRTTDPWVLRKHAEMLADAGVDAVVFDCSNGDFLWWDSVNVLMSTWTQAQNDGVNVPKIVFHLNFIACPDTQTMLRYLYANLYGIGRYQNLWYYVDGKPLIIAFPESLTTSDATNQAIRNFFTFRRGQGDYVNGDVGNASTPYWGWLETKVQHLFNGEEMTVGVSQNAVDTYLGHCYAFNAPGSYGRSYTRASGNSLLSGGLSNIARASFIQGYNFQEQWDTALESDPKYVFVTGWNEWIAGKGRAFPVNIDNTAPTITDRPSGSTFTYTPYGIWNGTSGPPAFADQYDSERSRDIEPTHFWGDYGDVYYYQLAKNIRQYKGVAAYPNVSRKKTMAIDGDFSGWESVSPDFKHYRGNTGHRRHYNHVADAYAETYIDNTGRNDFVDARVTRDNQYLYFYVETDQAITSRTDPGWMRLFINIDRDYTTGWKGYDFCLNYRNPSSATTGIVSRCANNAWNWTDAGTFDYAVSGNKMEIRVSRELLGVASGRLDFEFKWSDNMQLYDSNYNVTGSNGTAWVLDFLVSGDCAPGGRFNFHYQEN
jgi:hypothetical protein